MPHLEWEVFDSSLILTELQFDSTNWNFSEGATIEIIRDSSCFKLSGTIKGYVSAFDGLVDAPYVGVANIVNGQRICGEDQNGNRVELIGCLLGNFNTNSLNIGFTEAEIYADSLQIIYKNVVSQPATSKLEWFVCGEFPAHLWHRTLRNPRLDNKKIRIGLDDIDEDDISNWIGGYFSKDFAPVNCKGIDFLLARVPRSVTKGNFEGVCLEFRQNPEGIDKELLLSISNFLSFLFGNELTYIGSSVLAGQELKSAEFYSRNVLFEGQATPPIYYNTQYEWGDLSYLVNRFLPRFLEEKVPFSLEDALDRYWMAGKIPLGANLPVLAGALEIIASGYLRQNKEASSDYIPEDIYLRMISDELKSLQAKLKDVEGGAIMINKVRGAFRKGMNEKMSNFFKGIDLIIGKDEKAALLLRNKMTHGARDYSETKRVHEDLRLTRVYEMLFHRVFFAVIGYSDYYIDYSIERCPSKRVESPAGLNGNL
jgi:hypothetical protein